MTYTWQARKSTRGKNIVKSMRCSNCTDVEVVDELQNLAFDMTRFEVAEMYIKKHEVIMRKKATGTTKS